MSAHEFFLHNRPSPEFVDRVQAETKKVRPYGGSLSKVALLGEMIATAGQSGLRALAYIHESRGGGIATPERAEATPTNHEREYGAVLLGISLVSIEQTLVCGYYDYKNFLELINKSTVGTREETYRIDQSPQSYIQVLPRLRLKHMHAKAMEDLTLASFLATGNEGLIPLRMFNHLTKKARVSQKSKLDLVRQMLPEYIALAGMVKAGRTPVPQQLQEAFPNGILPPQRKPSWRK